MSEEGVSVRRLDLPEHEATKASRVKTATSWISGLGLLFAWIYVFRASWRSNPGIDQWTTADWLISYEGGFVRRGLFGEVVSWVAVDSQMAAYMVVTTQLVLLAVLYLTTFLLFLRTSRSPVWMMAVLSPAFLLFPALSAQGGLRKELLVLTALALLAVILVYRMPGWVMLGPLVIFALAAFSHETAALSLAPFLYLLWTAERSGRLSRAWVATLSVLWTAIAGLALLSAILFPGSQQHADAVCREWRFLGASQDSCSGAIFALSGSLEGSISEVLTRFPDYFAYLPLALVALLPLVLLRPSRDFWLLVFLVYVSFIPLFLTAIDYGRWIYLATSLVSICVLATRGPMPSTEVRIPLIGAVLYVTMWSLPYTGPVLQDPLYGRVVYVPFRFVVEWAGRL